MLQPGQILSVSPEPSILGSSLPEPYRYELRHCLGQRAGRQTWAAIDLETHDLEAHDLETRDLETHDFKTQSPKWVILKLLAFSDELVWQSFKLFEREARVLQRLDHPRLPRYRQSFSVGGQWLGLAQDYIPGQSLKEQLVAGHRFEEAEVRQIALDVLEILKTLHQLTPPILHRDIKPSNLIRAEDGEIYLIDWGAVQDRASQPGHSFTVVGTYGYAPLEQFGGRAVPASDLYALGTTLIHLLCRTAPADLPQTELQLQFLEVPGGIDRDRISPELVTWLQTLVHPDLQYRFSSAEAAQQALLQPAPNQISEHSNGHEAGAGTGTGTGAGLIARSYGAAPQITPQMRPSGSQIHIQRSADLLLVELPGSDLGQVLIGLGVVFFGVSLLIQPIFLMVALLFAGTGLWLSANHFVRFERRASGHLRLILFRAILGQMLRRTDEREVQVERLYHTLRSADGLDLHQSGRALIIQTQAGEYALGSTLTRAESRWLLEEIRSWLEM